jgi:hypothetical protein
MSRRALGLWTAGCLAVLLALGIARLGDWTLQWPVFVVPLVWALVALRPRRRAHRRDLEEDPPSYWDAPAPPLRTDTVEAPWVRDERRER